ncbi:MAG: hypothetical protein AAGH41_14045 [Pseudomonadota bacterium]
MKTLTTTFILMVLGFIAHEFGHAAMAKLLGYEVEISINHVRTVGGGAPSVADRLLIDFAGPAVTLILAGSAAILARVGGFLVAFWVVFTSAHQRIVAQAVSFSNPNDEMRMSMILDIGAWTVPAAMVGLFLVLTIWAAREARPGLARLFLAFIGGSIGITAVVFGEPYLPSIVW